MLLPSKADISLLAGITGDPCLSLYLPVDKVGAQAKQNVTRFKSALRAAQSALDSHGLRSAAIDKFLQPLRKLQDTPSVRQADNQGLAAFVSPAVFKYFELPSPVDEFVYLHKRFYLRPLFEVVSDNESFYLLALGLGGCRLLRGSRYEIEEIPLENLPAGLADALRFDEFSKSLQHHSVPKDSSAGPGRQSVIYHGHGAGRDDHKDFILRYFQQVDKALADYLKESRAPLVLAAIDYLHPIYARASHYPHLADKGIETNPDDLSDTQLRDRAWALLSPLFHRRRAAAAENFGHLLQAKKASADPAEIVRASTQGRVQTLFIACDARRWGAFDPASGSIHLHDNPGPDDDELLDLAAVHAFGAGADVFVLDKAEMPADSPLAAAFRW